MRRRRKATEALIAESYAILYEQNPMTLRQLFYQLVTRHVIPNEHSAYQRLSRVMTTARDAGDIPYEWIVDRSKVEHIPSAWENIEGYMEAVTRSYSRDRWKDQPYHLELWLEKDTLTGSVHDLCQSYGIPLRALRGFGSTTKKWEFAEYFKQIDKPKVVFYIGDHDPSGLDIERDLKDSLRAYGAEGFDMVRIAIFGDDIAEFNLPPLRIKEEARAKKFKAIHGNDVIEADALPPKELRQRLEDHILAFMDREAWDKSVAVEKVEKQSIIDIVGKWKELNTQTDTSIT